MKIKLFETFSGIGAQHQALKNLKKKNLIDDYEVVAISDWDVFAVRSYWRMHKNDIKVDKPNIEELKEFFKEQTLSLDGKTPMTTRSRFSSEELVEWFKSFKATKNIGSIVNSYERYLKIEEKPNFLTYSFPCQDLSVAGSFHGFNEGIKKGTRSGLLLEIEKLLNEIKNNKKRLPKYLLLENVLNLVQKNHKADFDVWLKELKKLGYSTKWGVVNSNEYGMIQARKRVFAISVLDKKGKIDSDLDENLKYVAKKYKLLRKQKTKDVFNFGKISKDEQKWSIIKNTPSRIKMINNNKIISDKTLKISTVTTKQDRHPNVGSIEYKNNFEEWTNHRFITPLESYKLMGFDSRAYKKAEREMIKTSIERKATLNFARDKLWKQAGNSIAVNILEAIFLMVEKEELKWGKKWNNEQ